MFIPHCFQLLFIVYLLSSQIDAFANTYAATLFTLIGCDSYDIDSMVAEAIGMITNAQAKIDAITSTSIITPLTGDGRAANNARSIFNSKFSWHAGLDATSKTNLATVRGMSPFSYLHCHYFLRQTLKYG